MITEINFSEGPEGDLERIAFIENNLATFRESIKSFHRSRSLIMSYMQHINKEEQILIDTYYTIGDIDRAHKLMNDVNDAAKACYAYNYAALMLEEQIDTLDALFADSSWKEKAESIKIGTQIISFWNRYIMSLMIPVLNFQANEVNVMFLGPLSGLFDSYNRDEYREIGKLAKMFEEDEQQLQTPTPKPKPSANVADRDVGDI